MIARKKLPHAILLALSVQPLAPEELRKHGRCFGRPHSVNVAIERLRESGLIEVKATITPRGRHFLRRVGP